MSSDPTLGIHGALVTAQDVAGGPRDRDAFVVAAAALGQRSLWRRSRSSSFWSARSISTWAPARHGWAWPPANGPDLWVRSSATGRPTCGLREVLPSYLLAQLEPGGRPSSAAVRWPAAIAGILAGLDPLAQNGARHGRQRRACLWASAGSEASP